MTDICYQTHTFSNNLNDREMIRSHLMIELQLFYDKNTKTCYATEAFGHREIQSADLRDRKYFFQLNLVFIDGSRTGFRSGY